MKILGPDSLQQIHPGSTSGAREPVRPTGFDDMLREALSPPASSGGVKGGTPLPEPRATQHVDQQAIQPDSLLDRTSRVIDLLENYTKALSNPQKTLRDIEPELSRLLDRTQSLYDAFLETGQNDSRLKSVMEALLRTAQMEDIRFRRGDYLDTE